MVSAVVVELLAVVTVMVLLAWYLSYSAARLDRLHHRVEGASWALETQLVRRATAAVDVATAGVLDPAAGLLVVDAATAALQEVDEVADRDYSAQSTLTRALQAALEPGEVAALRADPLTAPLLTTLEAAVHRTQLSRRFRNDAVVAARRVRRKRVVRWARLAGRAPVPVTVEFDDEPPAALRH